MDPHICSEIAKGRTSTMMVNAGCHWAWTALNGISFDTRTRHHLHLLVHTIAHHHSSEHLAGLCWQSNRHSAPARDQRFGRRHLPAQHRKAVDSDKSFKFQHGQSRRKTLTSSIASDLSCSCNGAIEVLLIRSTSIQKPHHDITMMLEFRKWFNWFRPIWYLTPLHHVHKSWHDDNCEHHHIN